MIKDLLEKGLTSRAFDTIAERAAAFPGEGYGERIDRLRSEFGYMSDFMLQGYKDTMREKLYEEIERKLKALDYDLRMRETLFENPHIKPYINKIRQTEHTVESTIRQLAETANQKEHYMVLDSLFMAILADGEWTELQMNEWAENVCNGNLQTDDAICLIGAITLSSMSQFSATKTGALVKIFKGSHNDHIKQRALVGAALSLAKAYSEDNDDYKMVMSDLMSTQGMTDELIAMQLQMNMCANAENDAAEINKNIMPNMMSGSPFKITRNGIIESEEESDSLDINAEERKAEQISEGVKKIVDMQKKGVDIFFSGFSQMKRYPLFYKISNWFAPFNLHHPDLEKYTSTVVGNPFIERVTEKGPFCDSDKYSFVIAFADVIERLPENMRSMMDSGEIGPIGMDVESTTTDASVIRLKYLQDLYRFFKLSSFGVSMRNPFTLAKEYALCMAAAEHFTDAERKVMIGYMTKDAALCQKPEDEKHPVQIMLRSFTNKESGQYLSCYADSMMRAGNYAEAQKAYAECLKNNAQDAASMRGIARACYNLKEYGKAAFYYDALHTLFPKRVSYALNYIMAIVMEGEAQSVVNEAYKLEFENPEDLTICNTLGWVLMYAGKAEQALNVYTKLLARDDWKDDWSIVINTFHAHLINGKTEEAAHIIANYAKGLSQEQAMQIVEKTADAMSEDSPMLKLYEIGKAEKAIVLSKINEFFNT